LILDIRFKNGTSFSIYRFIIGRKMRFLILFVEKSRRFDAFFGK